MGAISLADFVDDLQRRSVYSFTRPEAKGELHLKDAALIKALQRLRRDRRIMPIRRGGFYAIIPIEYQESGSVPVDWYIADFMHSIGLPYYAGLLTAAQHYGAAHQRPQAFQVVIPRHVADVETAGARIRFFQNKRMEKVGTQPLRTPTGDIPVSTPAWTAIDLVRFSGRIGGLGVVLTVLRELADSIESSALVDAARAETELAPLQRLGWLMDAAGFRGRADGLADYLASRKPSKVLLDRYAPCRGSQRDRRWQVMVNASPEADR